LLQMINILNLLMIYQLLQGPTPDFLNDFFNS